MNYSLQLHSSNRTYPVPRGLHDLMSDIAREVLRNKPQKIEHFIYKYLDSLIKIRKVGRDVATEVDTAINTGVKQMKMLESLGITQAEADRAASKMQAVVRGHQARKEMRELLEKKGRKTMSNLDSAQMTSDILKKYKLTVTQAHSICTKIQAVFRGWLVRSKTLTKVHSHESWRHDWLWKEFQMSPEEVQAVTHAEKKPPTKEELLFQPRRSIEIDHIKFMNAFKGELADYEDQSDTSSMEEFSPFEAISEDKLKPTSSLKDKAVIFHEQDEQKDSMAIDDEKIVKQAEETKMQEMMEEEEEEGKEKEVVEKLEQENEVAEKEEKEQTPEPHIEEGLEQEQDDEKDYSEQQISEAQLSRGLDEFTKEESFNQILEEDGDEYDEEKSETEPSSH